MILSRRLIVALAALWPAFAYAQSFPSKPITLIVPFPPGGSADGIARLVGDKLRDTLSATVVVENRAGAGGSIGLVALSKAPADGHTIGVGATGAVVINPHLPSGDVPFDPLTQLTAIAKLIDIPLVIVGSPSAGFKTLKEVLDQSKSRKDGLSYGSTGTNSSQHLAVEQLKKASGANLIHVAYRGSAPAMTDVISGQIPLASVDLTSAAAQIEAGKLLPLAVTSAQRSPLAPNIPTIAEATGSQVVVPAWMALFGPPGLTGELAAKLSGIVKSALEDPATQQRVRALAVTESYLGPRELSAFLVQESAKMRELVKP